MIENIVFPPRLISHPFSKDDLKIHFQKLIQISAQLPVYPDSDILSLHLNGDSQLEFEAKLPITDLNSINENDCDGFFSETPSISYFLTDAISDLRKILNENLKFLYWIWDFFDSNNAPIADATYLESQKSEVNSIFNSILLSIAPNCPVPMKFNHSIPVVFHFKHSLSFNEFISMFITCLKHSFSLSCSLKFISLINSENKLINFKLQLTKVIFSELKIFSHLFDRLYFVKSENFDFTSSSLISSGENGAIYFGDEVCFVPNALIYQSCWPRRIVFCMVTDSVNAQILSICLSQWILSNYRKYSRVVVLIHESKFEEFSSHFLKLKSIGEEDCFDLGLNCKSVEIFVQSSPLEEQIGFQQSFKHQILLLSWRTVEEATELVKTCFPHLLYRELLICCEKFGTIHKILAKLQQHVRRFYINCFEPLDVISQYFELVASVKTQLLRVDHSNNVKLKSDALFCDISYDEMLNLAGGITDITRNLLLQSFNKGQVSHDSFRYDQNRHLFLTYRKVGFKLVILILDLSFIGENTDIAQITQSLCTLIAMIAYYRNFLVVKLFTEETEKVKCNSLLICLKEFVAKQQIEKICRFTCHDNSTFQSCLDNFCDQLSRGQFNSTLIVVTSLIAANSLLAADKLLNNNRFYLANSIQSLDSQLLSSFVSQKQISASSYEIGI